MSQVCIADIVIHTNGVNMNKNNICSSSEFKSLIESCDNYKNLLLSIIDSPQDIMVYSVNKDFKYILFNSNHRKEMKRIWGKEISLGINHLDIISNQKDKDKQKMCYERALSGVRFTNIEEYGDERRERRFYEINYNPLYSETGEMEGITVFITDVTIYRQMKELQEINYLLEKKVEDEIRKKEKNEHILLQNSRMVAMAETVNAISDQWRQPLKIIGIQMKALINYIEKTSDINKNVVHRMAMDSYTHLENMSKVLDDFREVIKPDEGNMFFNLRDTTVELLKVYAPQLEYFNIKLDYKCRFSGIKGEGEVFQKIPNFSVNCGTGEFHCSTCPYCHILVKGFKNELKQVLISLMDNSKDALRRGYESGFLDEDSPGIISVEAGKDEKGVFVAVRDNAGGIPLELMDAIFEPFFSTKGESGTGTGLFVSKMLIEKNMGGKLEVDNVGSGASFTIRFADWKYGSTEGCSK